MSGNGNGNGKKWPAWLAVGILSTVFAAGGSWALFGKGIEDAQAVNVTQGASIKAVETVNQQQDLCIQQNRSDIAAETKERQLQMTYIREQLEEIKGGIRELKRP